MLRQVVSAPSRAVRSSALRAIGQRTPLAPQFRPAPLLAARSAQLVFPRLYSSETEAADKKSAADASKEDAQAAAPPDAEATLKKELETKTKEALEWKDRYLRSVADFRNLQDRTAREMKAARDFAIQKFAKDLVDSIDNLDRALMTVPADKLKAPEQAAEPKSEETSGPSHYQDLVNLHEGLKMTESLLMQTLAKHGLVRFDPHGEPFNPNEHEATFMTAVKDKDDNTIFHVQQKGFKLNGRILRPAKVGVVKNK